MLVFNVSCLCRLSRCRRCLRSSWSTESLHGWWRGRRNTSWISTETWGPTRPSWGCRCRHAGKHCGTFSTFSCSGLTLASVWASDSQISDTSDKRASFCLWWHLVAFFIETFHLCCSNWSSFLSAVTRWKGRRWRGARWGRCRTSPEEEETNWAERSKFPVAGYSIPPLTSLLLLYGWMSDFHCFGWLIYSSDVFLFQKQLEDYLNNLLKMPMYRNYHATVRITGVWHSQKKTLKTVKTSVKDLVLYLNTCFSLSDGVHRC